MDFFDANSAGITEHTGFPNPATDSHITALDINKLLIKHPVSTFFMQIAGNKWQERGIFDGDIIIIDRSLNAKKTDTIIWWEGEAFVISLQTKLAPDSPLFGVVTAIVHRTRT